jgi:ABC-type sugar transport system ATPase subunit
LLKILRILRDRNVGVVFVSHILEEVMNLCDEVTVLRNGRVVMARESLSRLSMADIVASMLGKSGDAPALRSVATHKHVRPAIPAARLTVEHASTDEGLADVNFHANAGEIVGLAGLARSGPAAMLAALAGPAPLTGGGKITLPGGQTRPGSFREAVARGVAFVSGDRRKLGLMLDKPIRENIVQVRSVGLSRDRKFLRTAALRDRAAILARQVGVKSPSVQLAAGSLSGGNQQKVVLAKWLDCGPTTLLLDDPTRGVDIGAREEINQLLRQTAAAGGGDPVPVNRSGGTDRRLRPGSGVSPGSDLRRAFGRRAERVRTVAYDEHRLRGSTDCKRWLIFAPVAAGHWRNGVKPHTAQRTNRPSRWMAACR